MSGAPAPAALPTGAAERRAILVAAAAAVLLFVPAIHGGFVYDDHRFLDGNPHLGSPSILWRAFADPACQTADGTHAGLWRPLRTLSFALDRALFGEGAAGPHAVNVLLHGAGTAALASLLLALRIPALAAALGSLVYALHPAQAECVAWISSRGDLIAAACVWGALVLELRRRSGAALALGAAALLAKGEQAVVWPVLVGLAGILAGRGVAASFRRAWAPAALAAAYVAARALVLDAATQEGGLGHGTAGVPVLGSVLAHQAWVAVVPVGLLFDWQMPWVTSPPVGATLVALTVLGGLVVPATRVAAAWFLAALAPTWLLQAFVPLNILVADRFLLFALPALALLVARGVAAVPRASAPACIAIACLGTLTATSLPVWRSDATLWTRTADRVPGHWRANAWLGTVALREGRLDEAERRLAAAAASAAGTRDAKTRFALAEALEAVGKREGDEVRVAAALENYRAAIALSSGPRAEGAARIVPAARWAEADLLLLLGQKDAARAAFRALLDDYPPLLDELEAVPEARVNQVLGRVRAHLDPALADEVREHLVGTETE